MKLEPIGHIESCFKDRFGTPRQPGLAPSAHGVVRLRADLNLNEAFDGIAEFSHIWLIFQFHKNANKGVKAKVHPPRLGGASRGVFATRTPHRPNALGLSVVKLERVQLNALFVSGLDLLDGTPIFDIKPYIPEADSIPSATAGWTATAKSRPLEVEWTKGALNDLSTFRPQKDEATGLQQLINETVSLDPRPGFYKGSQENPDPYTCYYGFRLHELNIVYEMRGSTAHIHRLEIYGSHTAYREMPRANV